MKMTPVFFYLLYSYMQDQGVIESRYKGCFIWKICQEFRQEIDDLHQKQTSFP